MARVCLCWVPGFGNSAGMLMSRSGKQSSRTEISLRSWNNEKRETPNPLPTPFQPPSNPLLFDLIQPESIGVKPDIFLLNAPLICDGCLAASSAGAAAAARGGPAASGQAAAPGAPAEVTAVAAATAEAAARQHRASYQPLPLCFCLLFICFRSEMV